MGLRKNLAEVQYLIQKAIRDKTHPANLVDLIAEKPPIGVYHRLKIYQDAYFIRMSESIREDFSICFENMDSEKADKILMDFIQHNPSRTRNLAEYSKLFPEFIQIVEPELYEVALRSWMEIECSHAADPHDRLLLDDIEHGADFIVRLHPAARLHQAQAKSILAYRSQDQVRFMDPSPADMSLLEFLAQGRSLDELAEFALQNKISDEEIMSTTSEWIKLEILFCQGKTK